MLFAQEAQFQILIFFFINIGLLLSYRYLGRNFQISIICLLIILIFLVKSFISEYFLCIAEKHVSKYIFYYFLIFYKINLY